MSKNRKRNKNKLQNRVRSLVQQNSKLLKLNRRNPKRRKQKRNTRVMNIPGGFGRSYTVQNRLEQIRIQHREFVGELRNHSSPTREVFALNPGVEKTFPWLSTLAMAFETYTFHQLCFEFVPSVGTSTSGTLTMAPDYDAADEIETIPINELMQHQDTVRSSIWMPSKMISKRANLHKAKQLYVRRNVVTGTDIKTYDLGNLAVEMASTSSAPGSLWVTYDVTLYTPQKQSPSNIYATGASSNLEDYDFPFSDTTKTDGLMVKGGNILGEITGKNDFKIYEPGYYIATSEMNWDDAATGVTMLAWNFLNQGAYALIDYVLDELSEATRTYAFYALNTTKDYEIKVTLPGLNQLPSVSVDNAYFYLHQIGYALYTALTTLSANKRKYWMSKGKLKGIGNELIKSNEVTGDSDTVTGDGDKNKDMIQMSMDEYKTLITKIQKK